MVSTNLKKNSTARVLGFEPRSKVLETSILPLNYTRKFPVGKIFLKSQTKNKVPKL